MNKLAVLEGLLFVVGDEGLTLKQGSEILEIDEETEIESVDVDLLVQAFLDIQKRLEYQKPRKTKIMHKELSLKEKTTYIRNILKDKKKVEFTELFNDISKDELVITFLSVLEMTKDHEVLLSQNKNFSKIYVEVYHE